MTLTDALTPLSLERFLQEYVGRRYLLVHGPSGRFGSLVSWTELNSVLGGMRVDDGRVRLVKLGQPVSSSSYVFTSPSGQIRFLMGPSLTSHVLRGATLIVNGVDENFPGIRSFIESCEDAFNVHVSANLYAAWRAEHGFDVHWDRHDTLILQILGRKHWRVWKPTLLHPLDGAVASMVPAPSETPIWDGVLEDGGLLYMPRGWWHVATPCDEPSLHVTVGIKHPTGADLLTWLVEHMKSMVDVRRDIPHWKSATEQQEWLVTLRNACAKALQENVIADYMDHMLESIQPRPVVRLPDNTSAAVASIGTTDLLRLAHQRRLHLRVNASGTLTFTTRAKKWQFTLGLRPALELLHSGIPCTLNDMRDAVSTDTKVLLPAVIEMLINAGVVWIERRP